MSEPQPSTLRQSMTPTNRPEAEILTEIANRVQTELPLLAEHLRVWLEAHRTHPRAIRVSSDPEGIRTVQVWLVTDRIGDSGRLLEGRVDAAQKMFGLVMDLQNGRPVGDGSVRVSRRYRPEHL